MKHALALLALGSALYATDAAAQFQNRGIGLNLGYLDFNDAEGLDRGFPLGLHASLYFDNNIEGTFHVVGMVVQVPGFDPVGLGFTFQAGARYLFMTDVIRPYFGLHVSYLQVFHELVPNGYQYGGIGPNLGIDYFLNDAWSIGLRTQANVFLTLNRPLTFSYGGSLEITTWY